MSTTRKHEFATPDPVHLAVELGAGSVTVHAGEAATSSVSVHGPGAEQVRVDHAGRRISVTGPRQRGLTFGDGGRLDLRVTVPAGSQVSVRTGSATLEVDGEVSTLHVRTGSGEARVELATGPATLASGSGSLQLGEAGGDLRLKSGSGHVSVGEAAGSVVASTGSGDVELGTAHGPVSVKTGSGSLRITRAESDVRFATGSGDLELRSVSRGRVTAKGASGDVRIGVPAGVPVWTDVATASGRLTSTLPRLGEPEPGQDHVEVRARTASGDVALVSLQAGGSAR